MSDDTINPCGGCGERDPEKRCIGCGHIFLSRAAIEAAKSPVVAPEQAAPELPRAWALSVTAPDAKGSMECLWFGNDDNGMKRHLFTADQMHAFRAEGIAAALAARQADTPEDWKRRALEAEFALGTGAARQAPTEPQLDYDLLKLTLEQTQERLRQADAAIAERDATALRVAQCAGEFARDAARQAPDSGRDAALEEAAKACDEEAQEYPSAGARRCAVAIRALKLAQQEI